MKNGSNSSNLQGGDSSAAGPLLQVTPADHTLGCFTGLGKWLVKFSRIDNLLGPSVLFVQTWYDKIEGKGRYVPAVKHLFPFQC